MTRPTGDAEMSTPKLISAAMIVKDEASSIERIIHSINPFVDEIVIVDTGSTDGTQKICRELGATVYEHPWQHDFSLHRNQAIGYATGEWLLIVDADEELVFPGGPSVVRRLVSMAPQATKSLAFQMEDVQAGQVVMRFNTVRLFRNGCVHYEGRVHNNPVVEGQSKAMFLGPDKVRLRHYGYDLSPEQRKRKFDRTVGLLRKRLDDDVNDYQVYFYLCQAYFNLPDPEAAARYGEIYMAHRVDMDRMAREEGDGNLDFFNRSIFYTMVHAYHKLGDRINAWRWLNAFLKELPVDVDSASSLVEFGVWEKSPDLIRDGVARFLKAYEAYKKHCAVTENRFIYGANDQVLSYCLYHLLKVNLEETSRLIGSYSNALRGCEWTYRKRLIEETKRTFSSFGFDSLSDRLPEAASVLLPGILDELEQKGVLNHAEAL